jgi:hypothetical protein
MEMGHGYYRLKELEKPAHDFFLTLNGSAIEHELDVYFDKRKIA